MYKRVCVSVYEYGICEHVCVNVCMHIYVNVFVTADCVCGICTNVYTCMCVTLHV